MIEIRHPITPTNEKKKDFTLLETAVCHVCCKPQAGDSDDYHKCSQASSKSVARLPLALGKIRPKYLI